MDKIDVSDWEFEIPVSELEVRNINFVLNEIFFNTENHSSTMEIAHWDEPEQINILFEIDIDEGSPENPKHKKSAAEMIRQVIDDYECDSSFGTDNETNKVWMDKLSKISNRLLALSREIDLAIEKGKPK